MKLTRSVSYAVSVLLNVERSSTSTSLTAAAISKGSKFPPRFLYRILRRLVDSGMLTGVSGPGGGYRLARTPAEISLLEVVEAVEGRQEPTVLEAVSRQHVKAIAAINAVSAASADKFREDLSRLTLAKIAQATRGSSKAGGAKVSKRASAKKSPSRKKK